MPQCCGGQFGPDGRGEGLSSLTAAVRPVDWWCLTINLTSRFVVFVHQLNQVGPDGKGGGLCSLDDAEAGACPAANQFLPWG